MNKEIKLTKKLYDEVSEREWKRLVKDKFHRLEFNTTLRFLKKYLPKKGLILDAGGGPGRYTMELAKKGYDIVLLDLSSKNLELAKKQIKKAKVQERVKGIVEGSITDLPKFKDNTFDAIICLGGPLSHIKGIKNRKKTISELTRVAKRNAPIFVSVIGKYAVLMQSMVRWPDEVKQTKHFRNYALKGEDYLWLGGRGYCHYFTLKELENLFKNKKIKVLEKVGLEGLSSPYRSEISNIAEKNPKAWKNWLWLHDKICTDDFVSNCSEHIMIIARKIGGKS